MHEGEAVCCGLSFFETWIQLIKNNASMNLNVLPTTYVNKSLLFKVWAFRITPKISSNFLNNFPAQLALVIPLQSGDIKALLSFDFENLRQLFTASSNNYFFKVRFEFRDF